MESEQKQHEESKNSSFLKPIPLRQKIIFETGKVRRSLNKCNFF